MGSAGLSLRPKAQYVLEQPRTRPSNFSIRLPRWYGVREECGPLSEAPGPDHPIAAGAQTRPDSHIPLTNPTHMPFFFLGQKTGLTLVTEVKVHHQLGRMKLGFNLKENTRKLKKEITLPPCYADTEFEKVFVHKNMI